MFLNGLAYWAKRILTRPRALARASRKLGLGIALNLVRIRMGSRTRVYELHLRQWPEPVFIRGGSSTDAWVLYEILVMDEYEHIGDLGSPRFIIDGGANIGLTSLYFLNRYPTVRIVAVEPGAETMEICRRNLAGYASRVTTVQGAIWSRPGTLFMEGTDAEWSASVRAPKADETGATEAFTMASLIARGGGCGVDLLKLDVEGSEREIFAAGAQQWLPSVRNICIELHGPDCDERFFAAMKPYRFDMSRRDSVYVCRNLQPAAIPAALPRLATGEQ